MPRGRLAGFLWLVTGRGESRQTEPRTERRGTNGEEGNRRGENRRAYVVEEEAVKKKRETQRERE